MHVPISLLLILLPIIIVIVVHIIIILLRQCNFTVEFDYYYLLVITIDFKPSTQQRRLFYRSNNYNTMLSIPELLTGNWNYNVISDSACTIRVDFMFGISYSTTF